MAGFFDTLFGGGAEREAADKNRALATQYGTDAQGYLKTGYDTGTTDLNKAIGAFDPLSSLAGKYNQAGDLYLNALGVNGPDAAKTAQSQFTTTPGYALSEAAGEDAINRRAGIGGMFNSGNATGDILKFAQNNLYGTQYAPWLAGLQGAGTTGATLTGQVAQGQSGGYTNLANLAQTNAQNQIGVTGNVLGADTSANTLQAQGEASGAKNLLGAGMSLATLAMGGNPFGGSLTGAAGGGFSNSLAGQGLSALKNLNMAQPLFAGGSPSGYGVG
jgi:hypothetical protein